MNGVHNDALEWNVGLVNHQGKYLTAETFGFKVNASGAIMRKKQLWTLEHDPKEEDTVYLKSHLGRYLSTDKKGNITCSNEEKGNEEKFTISYNNSGHWAFQSKSNSYYFGATEDTVLCYEKAPTKSEWWTIRLAVHPQVNLRNVNRKKYVRLCRENDKLQCDELIPWGEDALITLEFINGKYAIKSCDDKFLSKDGTLIKDSQPGSNSSIQFTLEIRSGQYSGMAFKDCDGKYLMGVGRDAVMQSKNKTVGKDELFTLEDSHPQVFITAHNGKMVSSKQGVDLTANQDELSDKETFQLEFDRSSSKWRLRTCDNKYWSLESANGIRNVGNDRSATGLFDIEHLDGGQIAFKASNGKYLNARMNGSLFATSDSISDKERFYITIINRPLLMLKCDYGFIGFKSANNPRIECNKASADVIYLEHTNGKSAEYFFKGHNGKYWAIDGEGNVNADSDAPQPFLLEMRKQSRFVIKAPNGNYIKGEQNGITTAKSSELAKATYWEY